MMENDDLLHYRSWYSTRRTGAVHELRGHRSPVNAVIAFGGPPPEDAAVFGPWVLQAPQLISASDDCTVKVWDAATGACMHTCSGHTARVVCLADIRGRHRVCVSGSYDWTLRSWDAAGGTCVAVMRGHDGEVNEVAAAGAGKVVSASDDGTLKVWDAGTGLCLHTLGDHGDYLVSVDGAPVSSLSEAKAALQRTSEDDVMVTVERDVERAAALEAAAREELKREEDAQRHQRAPSGGKLGRALTAKLMKDRAKAR